MAPSPQSEVIQSEGVTPRNDDDHQVVISGMSGLYPSSRFVRDLDHILYNKINPIKNDIRWTFSHPEAAQYVGNVDELDRFDSLFFKVHYRLANNMDVMARKVLEQAYEAIYDAGVCPDSLSGKKVGVYIGSAQSESEKTMFYEYNSKSGFGISGCSKTMFANRISYWLNSKGPSIAIDDSDCSSSAALEQAYCAISRGDCEAAIVGGANLCLHPQASIHIKKIIDMSPDGKTRSYAADASGFVKSEAVNVLFLQRAKDAVRIYADIVHVQCEFLEMEHGEKGQLYGFHRDPNVMAAYLKNFYDSIGIPPSVVEYVEGFGSANPKADKSELEAFDKVFCNNRVEPLLVGSVMSNIGHAEAASGISAVTKVLLGYHHGKLAGNLHCENPRNDVEALNEGRIQLLDDHREFRRSYAAVNTISMTGLNAHVLLNGHYKPKDLNRYKTNIPRLVTISGRQESSVSRAFEELKSHPIDPEELALLQNIHGAKISGHLGRGFILLDTVEEQTVSIVENVDTFDDAEQRPLWFVYSGMGSQWAGMGAGLMKIPIFAAAIERCHKVLAPKGLDLTHIITSPDKSIFDKILNSFVGIAAVQIGLTDVLRELGLVPDNIIGHSVGELGCAYADGCLTAEEMLLSAYSRGLVSSETPLIKGSMAAVGMGFQQVSKICPPEIEIACHNSSESCTISGPAEAMKTFVSELVAKGIFAKEVPCSNIAYHSRYIAKAGPGLLSYLNDVIKSPRERSKRWVSTSVSQDQWDGPLAKFSSAEYHTNNLLSPVLFEETSKLIPSNAVVVEVAPHGLLQAILKRSLAGTCTNIPLTRRGHKDAVQMLLEAVGQLYMSGYYPKIQILYPKVEFPVSTGTPFLSHYADWAHHDKWPLPFYVNAPTKVAASSKFLISELDDEYNYLKGHVIGNKTVIPFAFALVAVWDTFAMIMNIPKKKLSVKFSDIYFYAQPELIKQRMVKLTVSLHRGNGQFEVMNEGFKVASGYINITHSNALYKQKQNFEYKSEDTHIDRQDVHHLFLERGYNYSGEFRSIHSLSDTLDEAQILWNNNWVTLLDGMLQLNALKQSNNSITQVTFIRNIEIDVVEHIKCITKSNDGKTVLKAHINEVHDLTMCGGVLMENLKFREQHIIKQKQIVLKTMQGDPDAVLDGINLPLEENKENVGDVMLQSRVVGDLSSLAWVQSPPTTENGLRVKVQFAGIHMKDLKEAAGVNYTNNAETCGYGMEFSGLTESGERIMGLVENGSVRSTVTVQPELVWPVPSHWSLEDAATVPLAYTMAYYCFDVKSSVKMGSTSTVLVHGGAGALGQAVIAVGLAKGYRVFTTVSNVYKKKILLRLFTKLNEEDIGSSRDVSFADMVLDATGGKGCDLVFCSVEGELKNFSLKCCASYGLTFDATQVHNKEKFLLGMNFLTSCRNYLSLDITSILSNPNSDEVKKIHELVSDGIALGHVRPLTRMTFAAEEATRAFRLLAERIHYGRVLIKLQDSHPATQSRLFCSGEGCHIIFCDSQPLGPQLAEMLIASGAKKIHLHAPRSTAFLRYKLRVWNKKKSEKQVFFSSEDLQDVDSFSKILNSVSINTPIHGVHIASHNLKPELLAKLDLTTRKLCKYLKYFSVFTNDKDTQCVALERARNKLPVTVVNLSKLHTIKDEDGFVWYQGIHEAAERALQSSYPLISVQSEDLPKISLVQQIAALTDKCIPEEVNDETLLRDLGIEEDMSQVISSLLRDAHNVSIDEKQIPTLSIGSIKEIERSHSETEFEDLQGLDAIFTHVDPDELMATIEMVTMSTLTYNLALKNTEINMDDSYLYILPGLEGHYARFIPLCKRLKLSATVLQPGLDNSHETVQELADRYSKIVNKISGTKKHFHLLGFETGVFEALELAAILEQQGCIGTVYCIGDGPAETKLWIQEKTRQFNSEEELQTGILLHTLRLMAGEHVDNESLVKELSGAGSWVDRIDACVKTLQNQNNMSHSVQFARELIQSAYKRLVSAINYTPTLNPLKSQIVLLRTSNSSPSSPTSLQLFSEQPVVIHDLETPLIHSTKDMRCAALINRYLSREILDTFKDRIICDTYTLSNNGIAKA